MTEIVVKTKIKEVADKFAKEMQKEGAKKAIINISVDYAPALSAKVEQLITDSCRRARANGRNTVMAKDV
ncbi:MAG: hypothetical protein Q7J54_06810 [Candidatus Woesearchaeota archaeon]|nr:hypothetical protein [Candidatus Woesearchaeota archaeon]